MIKRYLKRDNPWELLAFAGMMFGAGLDMVLQKAPMIAVPHAGRAHVFGEVLSPQGAHLVGWLAFVVAVLFVGLYFHVRWSSTGVTVSRSR